MVLRLEKFGLRIAEEKTKIIAFGRFAEEESQRKGGGKPKTFDFLGFTHYCAKSRKGSFRVKRETSGKKFKQKVKALKNWIRFNRHMEQEEFLGVIRSKLSGHYRYYGITDNSQKMKSYYMQTLDLMYKWLNRRSQRSRFTRERFYEVLEDFKLPKPRIYVNIYD